MIARDVPPIPDSASRQPCGPAPQFTPMTSTSMPSSRFAAANGSVPSGSSTSSPNVSIAMIGRSADATRASSIAIARWASSENVSNWKRSTPPSSRPSMTSRNAARTAPSPNRSTSGVVPPSGPTEPATSTSRPATSRASRAIWAPRRANRPAWSDRPCGASRIRLAPKVAVSMRSAPASRYSRWIAPIRSGRVATSSSRLARCGMPRENRSVPMAPSARIGPWASRSRRRVRASIAAQRTVPVGGEASPPPGAPPGLGATVGRVR